MSDKATTKVESEQPFSTAADIEEEVKVQHSVGAEKAPQHQINAEQKAEEGDDLHNVFS